jgi:hypothetical protein
VGKFRKKPVVIEAYQLTKERAFECLNERKPFNFMLTVSGQWNPNNGTVSDAYINLQTLEGVMQARLDDWIIKGVKGELYPCKPDIFEATYEAAD